MPRVRSIRARSAPSPDSSGHDPARQSAPPCPVPFRLRTKVWLERDGQFVVGEGGLQLLLEIDARGSLLAAARHIGWSYRHAWQYVRRAELVVGGPLVRARPGKGQRRGTVLTGEGRRVVAALWEASARVDRAAGARRGESRVR